MGGRASKGQQAMNIGLMLWGDENWLGGVEYIKNLIRALNLASQVDQLNLNTILITQNNKRSELLKQFDGISNLTIVKIPEPKYPGIYTRIMRKIKVPIKADESPLVKLVREYKIDFMYPVEPDKDTHCPSASWIPDLQHRGLPHYFTENELIGRDLWMRKNASSGKTVVFSSQSARSEFQDYYQPIKSSLEVLNFRSFLSEDVTDEVPDLKEWNFPSNYFLVCGQFWQHKNHETVIRAVHNLKQKGLDIDVVMTGKFSDYRLPEHPDRIMQLAGKLGVWNNIRFTGVVSKPVQIALMLRAKAIIQPSLFEGWSTVVEEGHLLGCPMIVSDIAVHREQSPPQTEYFKPDSFEQLADMMQKFPNRQPHNLMSFSPSPEYKNLQLKYGRDFLRIAFDNIQMK